MKTSRAAARQQVDDQALVVDRHRHDRRAVTREQVARERVAGVLDRDHVARLQEDPGDQVQRLLRAVGGDHVLRARPGPRGSRPGAGPAPRAGPGGPRGAAYVPGSVPRRTWAASSRRQVSNGKSVGSGMPTRKSYVGVGSEPLTGCGRRSQDRRGRSVVRRARRVGLAPTAATKVPGADPRLQVSFGDQPLVDGGHGRSADAQVGGQRPGRREPVAGPEPAAAQRVQQRAVEDGGPVTAVGEVDAQVHAAHPAPKCRRPARGARAGRRKAGGSESGGALRDRRLAVGGLVLVDDALGRGLVELAARRRGRARRPCPCRRPRRPRGTCARRSSGPT